MKLAFNYAVKMWGMYFVLALLNLFFVMGINNAAIMITLNVALVLAFALLIYNDGGYNGEKACTLGVTLDRQIKEGRKINEAQKKETWNIKNGLRALVIMVIPFLLLSTINAAVYPLYPSMELQQEAEEETNFTGFITEDVTETETADQGPINWIHILTRLVFTPYAALFTRVKVEVLNILFFPLSLIMPLCSFLGYANGPRLRERKLKEIALGKKRKLRKMRREREANRGPKAEV